MLWYGVPVQMTRMTMLLLVVMVLCWCRFRTTTSKATTNEDIQQKKQRHGNEQ